MHAALASSNSQNFWIIDSGCSQHIVSNKDILSAVKDSNPQIIKIANNDTISSNAAGQVKLKVNDSTDGVLNNVLFVPSVASNLLSVGQVTDHDNVVVFDKNECRLYTKDCRILGEFIPLGTRAENDLNVLNPKADQYANVTSVDKKMYYRLGHISKHGMLLLRDNLARGVDLDDNDLNSYIPCVKGKQYRLPFPKGEAKRATQLLELVHSDVCGPISDPNWHGDRCFVSFTDDFSRKSFIYLMKRKNEVFNLFVSFKELVENRTGLKIKRLRGDNGSEYCNKEFEGYLTKNGIIHERSVAYSPSQNGVSERLNRTLVEKARCLLRESKFCKRYWGVAILTANYSRITIRSNLEQENSP